jgi:putative copper export protein
MTTMLLQVGAVWALNLALAWMVGACTAAFWLRNEGTGWTLRCRLWLQQSCRAAALVCLAAYLLVLWAVAAAMADVPLSEAGAALWMLLAQSDYGKAAWAAAACLAALAFWPLSPGRSLAVLVAFAFSRVANSHAAEQGLLTLPLLVEWLHLLLIALWVGGVAVAAWVVLPASAAGGGAAPDAYLRKLSDAATLALAGIVATGIFNAWRGLGKLDNLAATPYGVALTVKLVLVALAVALGGYNKLRGFPAIVAGQAGARPVVVLVLRIESLLLAAAVLAAAVLTSQAPPAFG